MNFNTPFDGNEPVDPNKENLSEQQQSDAGNNAVVIDNKVLSAVVDALDTCHFNPVSIRSLGLSAIQIKAYCNQPKAREVISRRINEVLDKPYAPREGLMQINNYRQLEVEINSLYLLPAVQRTIQKRVSEVLDTPWSSGEGINRINFYRDAGIQIDSFLNSESSKAVVKKRTEERLDEPWDKGKGRWLGLYRALNIDLTPFLNSNSANRIVAKRVAERLNEPWDENKGTWLDFYRELNINLTPFLNSESANKIVATRVAERLNEPWDVSKGKWLDFYRKLDIGLTPFLNSKSTNTIVAKRVEERLDEPWDVSKGRWLDFYRKLDIDLNPHFEVAECKAVVAKRIASVFENIHDNNYRSWFKFYRDIGIDPAPYCKEPKVQKSIASNVAEAIQKGTLGKLVEKYDLMGLGREQFVSGEVVAKLYEVNYSYLALEWMLETKNPLEFVPTKFSRIIDAIVPRFLNKGIPTSDFEKQIAKNPRLKSLIQGKTFEDTQFARLCILAVHAASLIYENNDPIVEDAALGFINIEIAKDSKATWPERIRQIKESLEGFHTISDVIEEVADAYLLPLALHNAMTEPSNEAILRGWQEKSVLSAALKAYNLSAEIVRHDKSISQLCRFNRLWHRPNQMLPLEARPLLHAHIWTPLFNPIELQDGYSIEALGSDAQLREEGEKMSHCVGRGSYSTKCVTGNTHIISIRKNGEPLATVEIERTKDAKNSLFQSSDGSYWKQIQIRGYADAVPPPEVIAVWNVLPFLVTEKKVEFKKGASQSYDRSNICAFEKLTGVPLGQNPEIQREYFSEMHLRGKQSNEPESNLLGRVPSSEELRQIFG